jgi:hypothetical protein
MNYLALGDSMSIDLYTGVEGGGAAAQLAELLSAQSFENLTENGATTVEVLNALKNVQRWPDLVTLTVGGNDLLLAVLSAKEGTAPSIAPILVNLTKIASKLSDMNCHVILNTIYDPTDGDDTYAGTIGLHPTNRVRLAQLNSGIESIARSCGFSVLRLHELFKGHGEQSLEPWLTKIIEPNLAGATAIAHEWYRIYRGEYPVGKESLTLQAAAR